MLLTRERSSATNLDIQKKPFVPGSDRLCLAHQHLALDSADCSSTGRSPDGSVLSGHRFVPWQHWCAGICPVGQRPLRRSVKRAYASRSMDDCIVVMERCLLRWPSPNGNLAANACKKTVYHRFLCELRGRERRPGAVNEKRMIA